jgi:hypothetical protein
MMSIGAELNRTLERCVIFFLKDPAIAGLRFSLVGRIFTSWPYDQGVTGKENQRKTRKMAMIAKATQHHGGSQSMRLNFLAPAYVHSLASS